MKLLRSLGLIVLVAACAAPAEAQDPSGDRSQGWIGISFEVSYDRQGRATDVLITDVNVGSPAEAAGLEIGDRLLAVNDLDRPGELRDLANRLRLRSGERVRMVVEREGRRREVRLRAGERPRTFAGGHRLEITFEPDSMVETMVRAMDSLRLRLVERRSGQVQDVRVVRRSRGPGGIAVVSSGSRSGVQAPFEFFVFRGEEHDSLRREMDDLNRVMADLEDRMANRGRELRGSSGGGQLRSVEDAELGRLRMEMEEASRRSRGLQAAMAEAARATAGFQYSVVKPVPEAEPVVESPRWQEYRPLTPYLLGRNRVAGAEVIDLRPEMAEYFRVEGGVLVLDVAPRTPASIAGIVPGDVITHIDQVVVNTVEELRFGISQADETLPLSLIRRGNSIQVLLRR